MFLYQIIPSTTSFSTSVSVPYEMLQGQGSLQAPRGASIAQAQGDAVPCGAASSGRNLLAQPLLTQPPLLQGFGIPTQGRGGRS